MDYRRLPLQGLNNARDLGGYPLKGGGITAYRRFIRCEAPRAITDSDLEFLKAYGVTVSIDFRGDSEISRHPSVLADTPGIEYRRCVTFDKQVAFASRTPGEGTAAPETSGASVTPGGADTSEAAQVHEPADVTGASESPKQEEAASGERPEGARPAMDAFVDWGEKYIEIVENSREWIRDTLTVMARTNGAVLFNCATGKDRTGVITALLLGIAGVEDCDIVADYCVSELYLRDVYEELLAGYREKWPDEKVDINSPFFKTAPENMERLLKHINETYDGVEGFVKTCNIGDEDIAALKVKLRDVE